MKYNRTYHLSFSEGATSDDKIAESSNGLIGSPIIITEKLDGSNTALVKNGVYGRSHADFTRNAWDLPMWDLWNRIGRNIDSDTYLFGENMYGIHSIEYNKLKSFFYLFGIRDGETWLSWNEIEEYSYLLDIPTVPVLFKGTFSTEKELVDTIKGLVKCESELGGTREGIVIRLADQFQDSDFSKYVQKWVRANHVTTDVHWQRNWRKAKLI